MLPSLDRNRLDFSIDEFFRGTMSPEEKSARYVDVAGTGNPFAVRLVRHSQRKWGAMTSSDLLNHGMSPRPYRTWHDLAFLHPRTHGTAGGPTHSALLQGKRGCPSITNTLQQHPPSFMHPIFFGAHALETACHAAVSGAIVSSGPGEVLTDHTRMNRVPAVDSSGLEPGADVRASACSTVLRPLFPEAEPLP